MNISDKLIEALGREYLSEDSVLECFREMNRDVYVLRAFDSGIRAQREISGLELINNGLETVLTAHVRMLGQTLTKAKTDALSPSTKDAIRTAMEEKVGRLSENAFGSAQGMYEGITLTTDEIDRAAYTMRQRAESEAEQAAAAKRRRVEANPDWGQF